MRIAIVGSGALGLFYGAKLARAGEDVHFLLRRDYQAVRENGLQVHSIDGDFRLEQVNAYSDSRTIGPVELVIVGLKTFANALLADLIRPLLGPQTAILTLQNGLGNEELLATAFGSDRILGGIAFLCSNRGEPGSVHHLGEGRIRLGEFARSEGDRATGLAELFQTAGVPCEAVADLSRSRWEKLVWNIPFNGLCAATGHDVTELLNHPPSRELVQALMWEVVEAANSQEMSTAIDGEAFIGRMLEMTDAMDHYRPSMMIDRLEGRQLELEAIYTIPLQRAKSSGKPMPRVAMLHALLDLGEQNRN